MTRQRSYNCWIAELELQPSHLSVDALGFPLCISTKPSVKELACKWLLAYFKFHIKSCSPKNMIKAFLYGKDIICYNILPSSADLFINPWTSAIGRLAKGSCTREERSVVRIKWLCRLYENLRLYPALPHGSILPSLGT